MPLDMWFPLLTLTLLASITWIFISSRRKIHPPLPPGPIGFPVVGNLPFLDPELHTYFSDLAKAYGSIFSLRLGSKIGIVVSSPSMAREVLKDLDATFANRDPPLAAMEATYGGIDIVFRDYGPQWRLLRKVCAQQLLGPATLDALYSLRKREVQRTMLYLQEHEGCAVNVGEQMFVTGFNLMTSMLWGETVDAENRASVGAQFRKVVSEITGTIEKPNVSDFFPGLARFDFQGIIKKMKDPAKKLDDILESVIDRRRNMDSADPGKDLLQYLLELNGRGDSKVELSKTDLKALFIDMIIGGTDSSSTTVEFAMTELMKEPQVMRKAQQELEAVVGLGNLVEESHIDQLIYLQAIMKETLRIHPSIPLLIPHSPSQTCIVGGYTVPKGSKVFINAWAIHRDPLIWEEPSKFKPERFLDGKYDFSGSSFNYIPFGYGRRGCPGIPLAEKIVVYFLASLLHYFDWKMPKGVKKVDSDEKFGLVLKKRTPLSLVPSPRLPAIALEAK